MSLVCCGTLFFLDFGALIGTNTFRCRVMVDCRLVVGSAIEKFSDKMIRAHTPARTPCRGATYRKKHVCLDLKKDCVKKITMVLCYCTSAEFLNNDISEYVLDMLFSVKKHAEFIRCGPVEIRRRQHSQTAYTQS